MSLYPEAIRDPRVREYLSVKRVLWQRDTDHADTLVGNHAIQPAIHHDPGACRPRTGGAVLLDFGVELHGGVRLVNGGKAARIRLRFGESVSEAMGDPNQDHAIHDAELDLPAMGMLEYGNTAFRFVRVDVVRGEPALQNVVAVALYRDLEWTGSFESSDERLNRIWKTGAYTLLLNMQDYIYDGAKRDRLVWMGDLHPEIRGMMAVFGDLSLVPKSLDFVRDATPPEDPMNGINTYSLWWIVNQLDYFNRTGNRAYLAEQKDYLRKLLARFATHVDDDGAETIPPRRFLDWPNNDNPVAMHAGLQGLLYWAMRCGAILCRELGIDPGLSDQAADKLSRHIPPDGGAKAAAAMMTVSGLADRSATVLADPFKGVSTFYGYYMLLAQPTAPALELIRRFWGAMLDYGATTFWEDFDLSWIENAGRIDELPVPGKKDLHADFGAYCYVGLRHSLCHGWAAGPTAFLSERVLGVRFLEPGGRRIQVRPDLGGLTWASGKVPHPEGVIHVEATANGKVTVDAPSEVVVER